MHLILYSKVGCHLCEGLQEKLAQITDLAIELEIREITTNPEWFDRYQYEIPVLCLQADGVEKLIPRFSPRASTSQVQQTLQQYSDGLSSVLSRSMPEETSGSRAAATAIDNE